MSDNKTAQRIKHLTAELKRHNELYYKYNTAEISDYEYDTLFRELQELERKNPHLKQADSPTSTVGAEKNKNFPPFRHPVPMYSLANAMTAAEMKDFINKKSADLKRKIKDFSVNLKYDGLAVELIYKNGKLLTGSTRGDGFTGENITENIKKIKNIPLLIQNPPAPRLLVRGEVILTRKGFKKINQERAKDDMPPMASPRNAASGSLRQLDPQITATRELLFFAYELANCKEMPAKLKIKTHTAQLKLLARLGLETGNFNARLSSFDSITNYYTQAKAKRNELKFEADGIVVKINRLEDQQLLGVSGKRPRYAIAWKFPPDIKTTYLKNINFQVGRTGLITPVGILEPVKINGAVISKVTLHNRKEIAKKDIRLNDKVEVIRSGDVIPKLLKPVTAARKGNEKKIIFPGSCPECGTALAKEDIYTRCVNPACPAKILNSIIHFASKEAMDIDGLGSEMLYTMIKKKIIKSIPDLYRLQPDQLDSFERMGAKLKANIINSINNSKKRPLDRLIYALGIRYIGAKTAKLLARKYKKIENLFDISRDELSQINEIGDTIACSVADYFNKPENKQTVRQLLELGVTPGIPAAGKQHFLSNKKIIFTGSLSIPRHRAKELALKAGADIVSAVSKKTDLVIAGEKPGSKYRKALAMNVKIVTEKKFLDMVKDLQ